MSYRNEFPDFPAADMPAIPADFRDSSWHNDSAPSFISESLGLILSVDYADPAAREYESVRFFLCDYDGGIGDTLAASDSWDEVLAAINARRQQRSK